MSRESGRESAMPTGVTCHHCKIFGHKVRDCKILARNLEMEKLGKLDNGRKR